ncbi:MAG TPA: FecR domain-containing protein, partial [Pyrinomonadaceae bacterium]|nr:FecR domain-containing protein [Pyrinomonadaceae bacterium]
MFSKHVTSLSSAYFHNELGPRENQRVAEHLLSCMTCRADFDDVKLSARFAEQLQIVSAPESIWPRVVAQLDQSHVRSARLWFVKPLAITAMIVALVAGGLLFVRSNRSTGVGQWNVARLGGSPQIDSQQIGDRSKLGVGQWLETDATSRAQIDVATIGNVEIDPNSRVRLLETNSSEHRLELARGRLSAHISAPPKLFFVNTPSGIAEDLGCAYTLEVDNDGNSILHVTLGWVSLQLTDRESSVPAGAACAMRRGVGPGTPYFEDASELFRTALAKFDFADNQSDKTQALAAVLSEARPRDVMTLWYLLTRVS